MGNKDKRLGMIKQTISSAWSEFVCDTEKYYRNKILSGHPLKDIIQESIFKNEAPILRRLINREFPQHQRTFAKYMIIQ